MRLIKYFLLSFIFVSANCAQAVGPKITVSESEYDFGTIVEGAIVSHEFFITNEGVSDLEIRHVGASCGCTVAKPEDEKLEPGESTVLKVTFDSARKVGNKKNYVSIYTNDKSNENLKIITTANVLSRKDQSDEIKNAPILSFSKRTIGFGTVKEGSVLEKDIVFKNNGKSDLIIEKVNASCDCTAALLSEEVIQPGKTGNLHVEMDTSNMEGVKSRTIAVLSNDPINPRMVITLIVNVLE